MKKSRKELIAAHLILLLAGLLMVAVGAQMQEGSWRDCLLAIGTTLVATPIVSFLLRYFSGDPIEDLGLMIERVSRISDEANYSGLVSVATERGSIPTADFVANARESGDRIWILTYAAEFLADDPKFLRILADRSRAGCDVRVLFGDPNGTFILARDEEEATEGSIPSRIETTIQRAKREMGDQFDDCVRLFDAPLYASLYRFDKVMVVCPALFSQRGSKAPAFRVIEGKPIFSAYVDHFSAIWRNAEVKRTP